jgi:PAS domain S-box-containing protein
MTAPIRILIVQESEEAASLWLSVLAEAGFRFRHQIVSDRLSFLQSLRQPWEVILCDYNLARSEMQEIIKETQRCIPLIFISDPVGERAAVEAVRTGAFDFILKSDLSLLPTSVKQALDSQPERLLATSVGLCPNENRENFFAAVASSVDCYFYLEAVRDDSGEIVDFIYRDLNPAAETLSFTKKKEVLGKTLTEVLSADFRNWMISRFKRVVELQEPLLEEYNALLDEERSFSHQLLPAFDGVVSIVREITRRKKLERTLEYERNLMHAFMENVPYVIWFKDHEGRFQKANKALANLLPLADPQQAIGKTDFDFFPEEEARQYYQAEQEILKSGKTLVQEEERAVLHDGKAHWTSWIKIPYKDEAANISGIIGIVRDITDQKKAEQDIRSVITSARCILWSADIIQREGRLDWDLNITDEEAAQQVFPVQVTPEVKYSYAWSESRHPEDNIRMDELSTEAILSGKTSYDQEFRCFNQHGEERSLYEVVSIEPIEAGRWRAVGVVTDITEQKREREKLRRAITKAQCILWSADIVQSEGTFKWVSAVTDEEAAQQVFPLKVASGKNYAPVFFDNVHPEDRQRMDRTSEDALLTGKASYNQEFRCYNEKGEERTFQEVVSLQALEPGRWYAVGVVTDITERKREQEKLRSVITKAQCILWSGDIRQRGDSFDGDSFDWDWSITDEEAARQVFPLNVAPGETYSQAFPYSVHPEDRPRADQIWLDALIAGDSSYSQEFRCYNAHGEIRYFHEVVSLHLQETGRWYAVGVLTDMTERKREQENLRNVITQAQCILWAGEVIQRDGYFDWLFDIADEEAAQQIYPLQVTPGGKYVEVFYDSLNPEDQEQMNLTSQEALLSGKSSYSQEFRGYDKNGEERYFHEAVSLQPQETGRWRVVGVVTDITEQKRSEEERRNLFKGARCILWSGKVEKKYGMEGDRPYHWYDWQFAIEDEGEAQQLIPLDVPPGGNYTHLLLDSRPQEDTIKANQNSKEALENGKSSFGQEYRCYDKFGNEHWLFEDIFIKPEGKDRWHIVSVCTDVTERKRAESHLQDVVSSARCLLWRAFVEEDEEGNLIWITSAVTNEQTAQEFLHLDIPPGKNYDDAYYESKLPDQWPRMNENSTTAIKTGQAGYSQEVLCRRADGEIRTLFEDVRITPLQPGKWSVTGVCTDVTESKRAEQAIRESETRKGVILDLTLDCVIGMDHEARIFEFNPAAELTFGYQRKEIVGKDFFDWLLPERLREVHRQEWSRFLSVNGEAVIGQRFETVGLRSNGEEFPAELAVSFVSHGGKPASYVYLRDITERKKAEDDLRRSHQQLEEALEELKKTQSQVIQQERLRALGQMSSGIAHDFNNALSPIMGFSELLLNNKDGFGDPDKARRYLSLIHTAAQDAASVVSRLREFYRPREGTEVFSPIDISHLMAQVISLSQPKWKDQALANGVYIEIQTELEPLPLIAGDESHLREALINLVFNAVDAMPQGGTITFRARREGDFVALEVADTGSGMSEEARQRCFEPFYTTKGERGTGMGLAMVHGIVRRHEGSIDVVSAPGQGTAFILRLPVVRGQVERVNPNVRPQEMNNKLRILFAEDDTLIQEVIKDFLLGEGHSIEVACDGKEGLSKFGKGEFDLVLTDRAMPGMNGDQLASLIKQMRPQQPIILMSGYGDLMNAAGEMPVGVDKVIGKPINLALLMETIREVLQEKQNVRPQEAAAR